ncbi:MAG TPA: acyltransferase [Acetobacteraceae bacterium]|nr:acyltransferase [Acetobacteraceae bacterium]
MSGAVSWTTQPERGGLGWMRLMARIALTLGWHVAYGLTVPLTALFLATAPRRQKEAARRYLARALGRRPRRRDLFRLYLAFAATMLDRVFILTGRTAAYDVTVEGLEQVKQQVAAGRGLILLGAHLGNFDALRTIAGSDAPVEIRALMHEDNAVVANAFYNALDPTRAEAIIALGRPDTMLRAKECLERGGIIGILGDRAAREDRLVPVPLLGAPAPLPAGPMQLAAVLGAPVILCAGFWLGPRRYLLRFEPFADRILLDRGRREEALAEQLARYAAWIERSCRAHPFNWFNFFDYWQELPK